jgi:hypothetical protein
MLAEVTTGEGHISRVLGDGPHVFMALPLADLMRRISHPGLTALNY